MERERESAPPRLPALTFGGFELDNSTGELRRDGQSVPLQPQPLKLLAHLAARPGELVTRAELQRLLWGEFSEVDVEHGLNFCIAQIRAALGDAGGAEDMVETLPRRGYRFRPPAPAVAPANVRPVPMLAPAEGISPALRDSRFGGRWRWSIAALGVFAVGALGLVLAGRQRAVPSAEAHAAALEAVRQARALRLQGDRVAVKQSIAAFEQALLLAPDLPGLRAELAATYLDSAQGDLWGKEAMEKARALAVRALQSEPSSSMAETTLGMVRLQLDWAWDDARRHLERGVALDPSRAEARTAHAVYLSAAGKSQEAVRVIEAVAGQQATTVVRSKLAWHLAAAGRAADAIDLLRSVLQEEPRQPWPRMQLVTALFRLGRDDEAFSEVKTLLEVYEAPPQRVAKVTALPPHAAVVEFFRGRAVNQGGGADSGAAIDPCEVALLYELAGEREQALLWLERAARERSRWLFPLATADPVFAGLRNEPRYRALEASWAR